MWVCDPNGGLDIQGLLRGVEAGRYSLIFQKNGLVYCIILKVTLICITYSDMFYHEDFIVSTTIELCLFLSESLDFFYPLSQFKS